MARKSKTRDALVSAIRHAGSQAALARAVSDIAGEPIGQTAVSNWVIRGRVPAERVLAVERAVNGSVSRHDLRPDLYPREAA